MCEPTTIVAAALAIKAGTEVVGSVMEHKAQNKANKANTAAANDAAVASHNVLNARTLEERVAAGQAINEGERQTVSASAEARLSAITSGVAGQSAEAVLGTIEGDLGRYTDSIKQNLDMNLLQIDRQRLGVEAERRGRIATGPQKANPWATGLSIARAGVDYATAKYGSKP